MKGDIIKNFTYSVEEFMEIGIKKYNFQDKTSKSSTFNNYIKCLDKKGLIDKDDFIKTRNKELRIPYLAQDILSYIIECNNNDLFELSNRQKSIKNEEMKKYKNISALEILDKNNKIISGIGKLPNDIQKRIRNDKIYLINKNLSKSVPLVIDKFTYVFDVLLRDYYEENILKSHYNSFNIIEDLNEYINKKIIKCMSLDECKPSNFYGTDMPYIQKKFTMEYLLRNIYKEQIDLNKKVIRNEYNINMVSKNKKRKEILRVLNSNSIRYNSSNNNQIRRFYKQDSIINKRIKNIDHYNKNLRIANEKDTIEIVIICVEIFKILKIERTIISKFIKGKIQKQAVDTIIALYDEPTVFLQLLKQTLIEEDPKLIAKNIEKLNNDFNYYDIVYFKNKKCIIETSSMENVIKNSEDSLENNIRYKLMFIYNYTIEFVKNHRYHRYTFYTEEDLKYIFEDIKIKYNKYSKNINKIKKIYYKDLKKTTKTNKLYKSLQNDIGVVFGTIISANIELEIDR